MKRRNRLHSIYRPETRATIIRLAVVSTLCCFAATSSAEENEGRQLLRHLTTIDTNCLPGSTTSQEIVDDLAEIAHGASLLSQSGRGVREIGADAWEDHRDAASITLVRVNATLSKLLVARLGLQASRDRLRADYRDRVEQAEAEIAAAKAAMQFERMHARRMLGMLASGRGKVVAVTGASQRDATPGEAAAFTQQLRRIAGSAIPNLRRPRFERTDIAQVERELRMLSRAIRYLSRERDWIHLNIDR